MDLKWLKQQLARPGYSQAGLARAMGRDPASVSRMLEGTRKIKTIEVPTIMDYLNADPDQDAMLPMALPKRPLAPPPARAELPRPPGVKDVPVWASASGGEQGAMILTDDPIDFIARSELMADVKNPFAFYVIGDSMSDVIEQGDMVVINPSRPPQIGKDHVFIHEGEGTMLALVKRLLRITDTHWRVRQYNPAKDFELPKSRWGKALRITEKRYG